MRIFLIIATFLPYIAFCRQSVTNADSSKITFEKYSSWQNVINKAQSTNKNIFVDCYATWCSVCKSMKKDVYSNNKVASFFNAKFISFDLQMDSSKDDNWDIALKYDLAKRFSEDYEIMSLPTLLFFSPSGQLLHKIVGYNDSSSLLQNADDALNPDRGNYAQYGRLKMAFFEKKLILSDIPFLLYKADSLLEYKFEDTLYNFYEINYLRKVPLDTLLLKRNIDLILTQRNKIRTTGFAYKLFLKEHGKIDSVLGKPGFSKSLITSTFLREVIKGDAFNIMNSKIEPNWGAVLRRVERIVGTRFASHNLNYLKEIWYQKRGMNEKYSLYLIKRVKGQEYEKTFNDLSGIIYWNNNAWQIFLHSNDKEKLKIALAWIEQGIKLDNKPNCAMMDTKANLLYKIGFAEEAISIMNEAKLYNKDFIEPTLKKMQQGEPTWGK